VAATVFAVSACSTLPISATDNVCNVFYSKPGWHDAALNMQDKWQVPLNVAMSVMYHESKFRRKAKPPRRYILGFIPWKRRSSAYGYAQAIDSTWDTYRQQSQNYSARRTNFYDSMDFVGWYIVKSENLARIDKADAYNQYLAYHEGWTGYNKKSYNQKQWLKRVASEVASTANRYEDQYRQCSPILNA